MKAVPGGGGSVEGLPELLKKYATTEQVRALDASVSNLANLTAEL